MNTEKMRINKLQLFISMFFAVYPAGFVWISPADGEYDSLIILLFANALLGVFHYKFYARLNCDERKSVITDSIYSFLVVMAHLLYCINIIFVIYWLGVNRIMNFLQNFIENPTASITTFTTFLGIAGFVIMSLRKYNDAKKYKIPFGIIHYSIQGFADILIEILCITVAGIAIPCLLLSSHINIDWKSVVCFQAIALFLCIIMIINVFMIGFKGLLGCFKILGFVLFYIISFVSFIYIAYITRTNKEDFGLLIYIALFVFMVYLIAMVALSVLYITNRVMGKNELTMTTCIEEQLYLLAVCSGSDKWILVKCEEQSTTLRFIPGGFMIKSLEGLDIKANTYKEILPLQNHQTSKANKKIK